MKRCFITALLALTTLAAARAQQGPQEKVQAFRIAIFTEVLQLTPEEAQGFWPIYNDYLAQRDRLQQQYKPGKQLDAMSDSEVEDQIKAYFEKEQKDMDLEKDLYQKLRKVLPTRKIAKIPLAERQFRESLLKKIQERQERRQEMIQQRRPSGGKR
jgi:hypothetical protein